MVIIDKLKNKVALITGGTSGIGRETAIIFAGEGAKVVIGGQREEEGKSTVQFIENKGGEVIFFKCNVAKEKEVEILIARLIEKYGTLDIAVNNAGISPKRSPLIYYSEEIINQIMYSNVKSMLFCLKYEINEMLKNNRGAIVNIASVMGLKEDLQHSLCTAGKYAVIGLTKAAALEYAGNGIRINAVYPGGVDAEIHPINTGTDTAQESTPEIPPLKKTVNPEAIANAIAFLCSDEAAFITGTTLSIND